jgi:hypothetical protein
MHSAQHYRVRAAEIRKLAESVTNVALEAELQAVAREYEHIADSLDREASDEGDSS